MIVDDGERMARRAAGEPFDANNARLLLVELGQVEILELLEVLAKLMPGLLHGPPPVVV